MKKLFAVSMMVCLSLFSFTTQAGEFADLRERILEVRTSMIDLLMDEGKRDATHWKAADEKSAVAKAALAALKAPAGKEAEFAELEEIVTAFLDTRDNELREALVKGDDAKAKHLLDVVQKDRFGRISALTTALDD